MKVGSLFSGIGGLDLGLERAGMTVAWQSEIDSYASRVLAKHWPNVPNLGDITTIDWSSVEPVDLICGGYPCQPFSLAGVRRGEQDARHLWPHFAAAIRHLRPRWALLENVPGHLSLGFGRVLGDLAELGYDTDWDCIPAAAVGAPHLRYRVFIVAHANEHQHQSGAPAIGRKATEVIPANTDLDIVRQQPVSLRRGSSPTVARDDGTPRDVADTNTIGRNGRSRAINETDRGGQPPHRSNNVADTALVLGNGGNDHRRRGGEGSRSVPQPGNGGGATRPDGGWWAVEPDVGRVAHGIPNRVDRLRTLGNAVVPQVAEWIGHQIMDAAA